MERDNFSTQQANSNPKRKLPSGDGENRNLKKVKDVPLRVLTQGDKWFELRELFCKKTTETLKISLSWMKVDNLEMMSRQLFDKWKNQNKILDKWVILNSSTLIRREFISNLMTLTNEILHLKWFTVSFDIEISSKLKNKDGQIN